MVFPLRMIVSSWFEASIYVINYVSMIITLYLAYLNWQDPASLPNGQSTQPAWLLAIHAPFLLLLGLSFFYFIMMLEFKSAFRSTRPIALHVLFASANLLTPLNPASTWSFGSQQLMQSCFLVFVSLFMLEVFADLRNQLIATIRDILVVYAWTPFRPVYV